MIAHTKIASFLILLLTIVITSCDEDNEPVEPKNGLVANAGSDHSLLVNDSVRLDGSASFDKNDKAFSYLWSIKSKPAGSVAEIGSAHVSNPLFSASVAGDYVVQLQILQGQWSAKDELTIRVQDHPVSTVILSEAIQVDTNLEDIFTDPSEVDYIVTADIDVRANLTVEPGVVIAFERDKGLQVISGSLHARGNASQPIVFKGTESETAYWKGLLIHTNSDLNVLEYFTLQGGGSSAFSEIGVATNIGLAGTSYSGAALRMSSSTITGSGGYGLYLKGSSSIPGFAANTFTHNAEAAAYIPARELHNLDLNSQATYNGFNGPETGGTLNESDVTWQKGFNGVILVTSDIMINRGLNIEPGVALAMNEDVGIIISPTGYLNAAGTSDKKILFTSTAVNKYWNGLAFHSASYNNVLDHCIVSNGGRNRFADADQNGNIVVGAMASVKVRNSTIKNTNGYGIVTKSLASLNVDVLTVNQFDNLSQGKTYPAVANNPDKPFLKGTWVDRWTFNQGKQTIDENLYDVQEGEWFGGTTDPYSAYNAGFGLKIGDDNSFVWTIVEYFPIVDCRSITADYITGEVVTVQENTMTLNLDYWRSMFSSSCDPTQNVDTGVEVSPVTVQYEINEMFNVITGERYWELKFFRPDNSTYSFYRR